MLSEDHASESRKDLYAKIFEASRLLIAALLLNPVYFNLICNHGMVVVKVSPVAVYFAGRQRAHNWKSSDLSGKNEPRFTSRIEMTVSIRLFNAVKIRLIILTDWRVIHSKCLSVSG